MHTVVISLNQLLLGLATVERDGSRFKRTGNQSGTNATNLCQNLHRGSNYREGPLPDEGQELPELEGEAHGEHDEAQDERVGPRRHGHEPAERIGPHDGDGGAGRYVGRV